MDSASGIEYFVMLCFAVLLVAICGWIVKCYMEGKNPIEALFAGLIDDDDGVSALAAGLSAAQTQATRAALVADVINNRPSKVEA